MGSRLKVVKVTPRRFGHEAATKKRTACGQRDRAAAVAVHAPQVRRASQRRAAAPAGNIRGRQHSGSPGVRPEQPGGKHEQSRRNHSRKLLERLTAVDVDARNLAIEVMTGSVIVRGSVPTEQQRERTIEALAGAHSIEIVVRPVAPSDSADGRGRSPITGTSAESAHQSRRQTDPT